MRIVSPTTSCKNGETALHWANLGRVTAIETKNTNQDNGIAGAVSTDSAQDIAISNIQTKDTQQDSAIQALQSQTGGGLNVVDSLSQKVGTLLDVNRMVVKVGNVTTAAIAIRAGFISSAPDNFFGYRHTSTDCTALAICKHWIYRI